MMGPRRTGALVLTPEGAVCTVVERAWGRTRTVESFPVEVEQQPGGPLPGMASLAEGLKRLECASVVVGLSLVQVIVEHVELPAMKKTDLDQALPFEIERHLPLPLAEFAWSYGRATPRGKTNRWLVAAVRKAWAERLRGLLAEAGVSLLGCRLVHLERARVLAPRMGDGLVAVVARHHVEWAEIRGGMVNGLGTTPLSPAIGLLETLGNRLAVHGSEAAAGKVVLFGEGGADLVRALAQKTGRVVETGDLDPGSALAEGHFRTGCPDLLLAGMAAPDRTTLHRNVTAALLAAALVLSFLSGRARVWKQESALESAREEVAGLKNRLRQGADGVDAYSVASSLNVLRKFAADRNGPTAALGELARRLPGDAWLHSFDMNEKGKIRISGFAEDSALLVESLADSPAFSSVQWEGTVIRGGSGQFKLQMQWKGIPR